MSDSSVRDAGSGAEAPGAKPPAPKRPPAPQESMIDRIRDLYGARSRVMLHESPEESGPLLGGGPQDETPSDDSQYQVLGLIAKGGVGVVYKARDKNLGREVALKVLRSDRTQVAQVAERLVEEAQVGGQLQHPGIVPVYALGMQKDGRPHFAMKLIKGETLASLLQDRAKPQDDLPRLLGVFEQVCQTMAYCHDRGVIHRDLKPSNIMVGAFGETLIVDWGFGKVVGRSGRGDVKQPQPEAPRASIIATLRSGVEGSQSIAGAIMGTPAYMPPEQALGQVESMDQRADVFALGAVLCEILTGEPPYAGDVSDIIIMAAQGKVEAAHGRLDQCGADKALTDLAKHCLSPLIADRPRNAGAVAERIQTHFAGVEERARQATLQAAQALTEEQEERARLETGKLEAEKEKARAAEERLKAERAQAAAEEQQRAVVWERQRRRRTIALAAAVLLLVVIGGASYTLITGAERDREQERDTEIAARLGEAMDLAGAQRWSEAAAAAEGALPLFEPGDERAENVQRIVAGWRGRQAELDAVAAQAERDRKVDARLRELRTASAGRVDPVEIDAAYAQAFREYGVDADADASGEAGRVLFESKLRVELAAGLDDWANLRRGAPALKGKDWRVLLKIANQADNDPWRMRLREARANEELVKLAHMASSGDVSTLPAATMTQLASALVELGDAPGAARILRIALEKYPDDLYVHLGLAAALVNLKPPRFVEGARHAQAALALDPGNPWLRELLAMALAGAEDWSAAAVALDGMVRDNPDNTWALTALADALLKVGDLDGAAEAATKAVTRDPEDGFARLTLLDVLAARADAKAYRSQADAALLAFPGQSVFLAHLAAAMWRTGDAKAALAIAEEAAKADPTGVRAGETLADLLVLFGRPADAVTAAQAVVDGNPGDVAAERALVRAAMETGQMIDAEAQFVRRLQWNPSDVGAHWGLAAVFRARGDLPRELHHRREVVRLAPYDPDAHVALGDFLRDRAYRFDEAAAAYGRAIELRPETARHHAALGLALARKGDVSGARDACRRAQDLGPRDATVQADCARVLALSGRAADAKDAAARAAAEQPEIHGLLQALGACQLENGDLDGALATLDRAVKVGPDCPRARLLRGQVRRLRGDVEGAVSDLQRVVQLQPRSFEGRSALGAALEARGEDEPALAEYLKVQGETPRFAGGYVAAARLHCRAADASLRRPDEALALAQRGLDLDPQCGAAWSALAFARLRNGDAAGALAACETALGGPAPLDAEIAAEALFVRAMAEHQRGRAADARAAYREGVARAGPAGSLAPLQRTRSEAAQLLGEEGK